MKPLISISQIFDTAWDRYTANLMTYSILALILVVPDAIIEGLKWGVLKKSSHLFGLFDSIGTIITILCSIVAVISLVYAIADNAKQPWRVYYEKNFGGWKRYIITCILRALIVIAGFALLVIPGIIFLVEFCFADWIALLEGKQGMEALHISRGRVRGRGWAVLGRLIGITLISAIAMAAISFLVGITPLPVFVANILILLFVMPFSLMLSYVLYEDMASAETSENMDSDANTKPVHVEPAK
jgi:TRAP-type mannitol/chloroaromatic compound transport system permease small subunit